jgi:type II secretory pathway component GspD/PulD (secretin)
MSVIDVVILRTEDQIVNSYGLNVLNGLNYFFGAFRNSNNSNGSVTTLNTDFSGIGGVGSSSNGASALSYSLNIANSTNNRNEVLARPSLIALDRLPSTFFSGDSISIPISANAGGVSQLVDKQIGVSLSVTPTFIDDETLILSLKAVRSFAELPLVGTSGAALSVSKNSVTANVIARYGETIILSGLNERELIRGDSGIPILKEIPGLQYLFSQNISTDYFRTVAIMVTPRKPISNETDRALAMKERTESEGQSRTKKYSFHWRIEEYEKYLSKAAPNFDAAIDGLYTNNLYNSFKSRDLIDTNWARKPKLEQFLHNLGEVLWH